MAEIDFDGLGRHLLGQARNLLPEWLPGGRLIGAEYCCGNLRGEQGDSLKVNVNSGKWCDFATNDKGGDLISLYAAINNLNQVDAAKALAGNGFITETRPAAQSGPVLPPPIEAEPPPDGTPAPTMIHTRHGKPSAFWAYRDPAGRPLFYVARYDTPDGKDILPWSWSGGAWRMKGWPAPRPLYNLPGLSAEPDKPVLVVEGEKAADAAARIARPYYVVVTWPNGSNAVSKADWTPLYGRKILLWPDADEPGAAAMGEIARILGPFCVEVKILDPEAGPDSAPPKGWDAADALAAGYDWERFKAWAKARVTRVDAPTAAHAPGKKAPAAVAAAEAVSPGSKAQAAAIVHVHTSDDAPVSESLYNLYERIGIPLSSNGQPIANVDAVLRLLDGVPAFADLIWFDEFHQRYFTRWNSKTPREWADVDTLRLTAILQREYGMRRISDEIIHKACIVYAQRRPRNEPLEWIQSLTWDGTERIAGFFVDALGAEDGKYTRAASANWWISIVARILRPGSKVDNMVIFEGGQGKFKSTALARIGGAWYCEAHESVTSKDFYMALQGKLIVEISELEAFSRAEVSMIKKVITCQVDRFRPPYGRTSTDFPRRCVFVGTTNEDSYLKDHTGARRFWPIKIGQIDLDRITRDRDQLYAEAAARFNDGAAWYLMPQLETDEVQESRRQADEWETAIAEFLVGKGEVRLSEVAHEALKIGLDKLDLNTQRRIGRTLMRLGWTKHNSGSGGAQKKVWREPSAEPRGAGLFLEREPGEEG